MKKEEKLKNEAKVYIKFFKMLLDEGIDISRDDIHIITMGKSHIYIKKYIGKTPPLSKQYKSDYKALALSVSIDDDKTRWLIRAAGRKCKENFIITEGTQSLKDAWKEALKRIKKK